MNIGILGAGKKMDIDCGIGSINVAFMEQL